MTKLVYAVLIVPLLLAPANAAGSRSVDVQNKSGTLIDVGFRPNASTTLSSYGTVHAGRSETFKVAENDAKIVVRSQACHGPSFSADLPQRSSITVVVEKGCKLDVK
jgi:hypothetical protein